MQAERAWQATLGQLQIEMPKAAFDTWVREAKFLAYEDGSFVIGVANAYARDWLESRLKSTATRLLTGLMGRSVEMRFVLWKEEVAPSAEEEPIPLVGETSFIEYVAQLPEHNDSLNPRYSFENFVVGTNNRLAHAASLAVAEKPAEAYNPLFLYGGVGLGKTHLLHAIGNACFRKGLQVLYVSSEEFTNDLINAIRAHSTQAFREKYRRMDVLLVDDIQFIAGKESTQEEFFHTFNTLHGQNKQIVVTSDRPPKALITLEERLCSRFEWGLTADIQPPDYETRLAILRSKAERMGVCIADDFLGVIARRVQSNIRELEGALTRVTAYMQMSGQSLSLPMVETILNDLLPRRKQIHPQEIIECVAEAYHLAPQSLLSKSRARQVAVPRQIAMYLMREYGNISLPQIGEALGGRDHTTVLYGCEKIADMLERDDRLRKEILEIKEKLYGNARSFQPSSVSF